MNFLNYWDYEINDKSNYSPISEESKTSPIDGPAGLYLLQVWPRPLDPKGMRLSCPQGTTPILIVIQPKRLDMK